MRAGRRDVQGRSSESGLVGLKALGRLVLKGAFP